MNNLAIIIINSPGWGRTSEGKLAARSPILMQVQLPVIHNDICREKFKLIGEFKDNIQFGNGVLCAGFAAGGKDSCQGDSGKCKWLSFG